jgi:drug/metabolite transporter (DMT)-like permease
LTGWSCTHRHPSINQRRAHLDPLAAGLLVFLCALWGFQQVTIKLASAGISPAMQAGLRSIIAVMLLWLWMQARGIRLLQRDGTFIPGIIAGLLFALEFLFLFWGLTFTSASRAIVFLYVAPFVVTVGVHFLVPEERLGTFQAAGLLLAFAGVAAIFAEASVPHTASTWPGDLMALAGGIFWGLTTLIVRTTRLVSIAPSRTLFYQLAVSALVLPIASFMLGEPGVIEVTPLIIACLAFQGVIVAFASYLAWFWMISRYPAPKLSSYTFLAPVFGVVSGILFLREPLTAGLAVGALLVGTGIWIVNRRGPAPASALRTTGQRDG